MSNICRQKWKFRICEQSKVRTRKIQSWSTGPTRSSVHVRTCRCPRMHSPMPSFILGLAGRANSNAKYTRYTGWWKIRKIHRVAENTQGTQNSAKYASYTEQWKCAVACASTSFTLYMSNTQCAWNCKALKISECQYNPVYCNYKEHKSLAPLRVTSNACLYLSVLQFAKYLGNGPFKYIFTELNPIVPVALLCFHSYASQTSSQSYSSLDLTMNIICRDALQVRTVKNSTLTIVQCNSSWICRVKI